MDSIHQNELIKLKTRLKKVIQVEEYEETIDNIRAGRMERVLVRHDDTEGEWIGIQPFIIQMGTLYDREIVLTDTSGIVVAATDMTWQLESGR